MAKQETIFRIDSFQPSTGELTATAQNAGLLRYPHALIGTDITLADRLAGKVIKCDGLRLSAKVLPGITRRLISEGIVLGLSASSDGIRFTDQTIAKQAPAINVYRPNANDLSKAGIVGRMVHALQTAPDLVGNKRNYSVKRHNKNAYVIGRI